MNKQSLSMLPIVAVILTVVLAGCGRLVTPDSVVAAKTENTTVFSNTAGAVMLPEHYLISYNIESPEGVITALRKGVDTAGNVYFSCDGNETLFTYSDEKYTRYETEVKQGSSSTAYTNAYVEQETAIFMEYAEKSKLLLSGAAIQTGKTEVAGRSCESYQISVTVANFTQSYEFAIDVETGICLSWQADKTISGYHVDSDESSFVCTEFIIDDVKLPLINSTDNKN